MARPNKIGLDYFPFDIDFFDDEKIVAISGEFGIKGEITAIKLLCAIYRNGYFILWNDLLKFKLLKNLPGISSELLDSIVNRLVMWGFFDKNLFDSMGVLTSVGIQKRYFKASKRRKSVDDFRYLLVKVSSCENDEILSSDDGDLPSETVNVCNNEVNVCNNLFNDDINVRKNTTKKRKENIEKEISSNEDTKKVDLSLPDRGQIDYNALCSCFNSMFAGKLPVVVKMTYKRKTAIRARIAEHGKEAVVDVFKKVLHSPFLLGYNDRNWKCNFEWIFKPSNFVKILEGNYDGENYTNNRSSYTSKQEANAYALGLLQQHKRELEEGLADEMERPF